MAVAFSLLLSNSSFCAEKKDEAAFSLLDVAEQQQKIGRPHLADFSRQEAQRLLEEKEKKEHLKAHQPSKDGKGPKEDREDEGDEEEGGKKQDFPIIHGFVELMKNKDRRLIIPQELGYIQEYFKRLEEVEQRQYDILIDHYKKAESRGGKNPASIAVLSRKNGFIKEGVVKKEDKGALLHTEQELLKELITRTGRNLSGIKIGLYTQNSPCILKSVRESTFSSRFDDTYIPCTDVINTLVHQYQKGAPIAFDKPAENILVRYDVIYDDPRCGEEKYSRSHLDKLTGVLKCVQGFLEFRKNLSDRYKLELSKQEGIEEGLRAKISKRLEYFNGKLRGDLQTCKETEGDPYNEAFSYIANVGFLGSAINHANGQKKVNLILTYDFNNIGRIDQKTFSLFEKREGTESPLMQNIKIFLSELDQVYTD